jgi:hypothetical protein
MQNLNLRSQTFSDWKTEEQITQPTIYIHKESKFEIKEIPIFSKSVWCINLANEKTEKGLHAFSTDFLIKTKTKSVSQPSINSLKSSFLGLTW